MFESENYMNIFDVIEQLTNATGFKYNSAVIEFRQLMWASQWVYNALKTLRHILFFDFYIYQLLHILMFSKTGKLHQNVGI